MSVHIPDSVFEAGILDREFHSRLIADLDRLAKKAGIPSHYVWTKLGDFCTPEEIDWVRKARSSSDHGLVLCSPLSSPVECKMGAMAGAFLRNYINARVMTVQEVLDIMKSGNSVSPTVALVPNFSMSKSDVASVAPWESAQLLSWLYSRLVDGKKTVLFVGSMKALEESYGEAMAKHLRSHYSI